MGRWEPNAQQRLLDAAMALFVDRGYEGTTVADIAERAGVTSRTFFRLHSDKREVLFAGSGALEAAMVDAVLAAPAADAPMDAVARGLDAAATLLGDRWSFARARHAVIVASPELSEREAIKMATFTAALARALRARGVREPDATLAAECGIAVFRVAFGRWVTAERETSLRRLMASTRRRQAEIASAGRSPRSTSAAR